MRKHLIFKGKVFRPSIDVPESDRPCFESFTYDTVDGIKEAVSAGEYDRLFSNIRFKRLTLTIENSKAKAS